MGEDTHRSREGRTSWFPSRSFLGGPSPLHSLALRQCVPDSYIIINQKREGRSRRSEREERGMVEERGKWRTGLKKSIPHLVPGRKRGNDNCIVYNSHIRTLFVDDDRDVFGEARSQNGNKLARGTKCGRHR